MRVSKWGFKVAPDLRTFVVNRLARPEELLEQLRAQRRALPKGFRFDRDDANARR